MNTAKILKETEKAYFLHYGVNVWEEMFYIKTWMPKSMINVSKNESGIITFEPKNNWILGAKVKDYLKYIIESGLNISDGKRHFLELGKNEDVTYTYYTGAK